MYKDSKVASRYSKAIFDYLGTKERRQVFIKTFEEIVFIITSHKELYSQLCSKIMSYSKKKELLEHLAKKMKFSNDIFKVLCVLMKRKRLNLVSEILSKLKLLVYEEMDIVPLTVESAYELNNETKIEIRDRLTKVIGKNINVVYKQNPDLIGGIKVFVQGKTFDGSVIGFFSRLEESILGGLNAY